MCNVNAETYKFNLQHVAIPYTAKIKTDQHDKSGMKADAAIVSWAQLVHC